MKDNKYKIRKQKRVLASEPPVPYGHSAGEGPLTFEKVWQHFQETERLIKENSLETDRKFQETDRNLNRLEELFVGQWGKLVESLVKGKLIELLNNRGIKVVGVQQRAERLVNGKWMEIDLTAVNTNEVVAVEVKTTLRADDVKKYMDKLHRFKNFFPEYKNYSLIGAVAYIKTGVEVEVFAQKQGLFTIRATGDSASITNNPDFKPAVF